MSTETKTKLRGRSKPQLPAETLGRRKSPIIVFGVDLSLAKGIAWALAINERIVKIGIEEKVSLLFRNIPNNINQVITEKMFVPKKGRPGSKKNALDLAQIAGQLEYLCDENDIPFRQILGNHWQQPIKKAFSLNGKPIDMTPREWEKYRYKKYRIYVYGFLANGIKNSDLSNDEIAAACLALHGSREIKRTRLFGLRGN